MARRFNNKTLLVVFAVLAAAFLAVKFFGKRSAGGNFPEYVVNMDTAGVDRILMNPKAEKGATLEFSKVGGSWRIKKEEKNIPAAEGVAENIIFQISNLKPTRLATRNEENWSQYDLTDSLGTRVRIYRDEDLLADVMVGKISYKQLPGPQGQFGGQPNITGNSFVRLTDGKEVYTVTGFLGITFNRDFNSYRNQTFLMINQDSLTTLEFIYPADTGFVVQRVDSVWAIGTMPVDQDILNNYVRTISNKRFSNFNDDFKGDARPVFRLIISEKGTDPVTIQAFDLGGGTWILNSSLNSEGMFEASDEEVQKIFPSSRYLGIAS